MFSLSQQTSGGHEPLYRRIAATIREAIVAGHIADGAQLPPEPDLAVQFGVNRLTVRKGLKELEKQHLIIQQKGRGTFVTYRQGRLYRIALAGINANDDLFGWQVITGLERAFAGFPHELVLLDNTRNLLKKFQASQCDAIIIAAPGRQTLQTASAHEFDDIPLVLINARPGEAGNHVCVDAAPHPLHSAMQHLAKLGHRRVGYITLSNITSNLDDRDRSFRRGISEFSFDAAPELFQRGALNVDHYQVGRDMAHVLCHLANPPTAIICPGASIALGAWQGIMECHIPIPQKISLIGFGVPQWTNPILSSLFQPQLELAETAGRLLLEQLRGKHYDAGDGCEFATVYIERGSTAAPYNI